MPPTQIQPLRRILSVTGPNSAVSPSDLIGNKSSTKDTTNDEKRLIAADHDDEAEDQLMNRNPRDWPFPAFEPAGEDAARRKKRQLKQAREAMVELQRAPAVIVINAPHETDRPPWKAAITVKHVDPPPLDLRAEKKGDENNTNNHNNNHNNVGVSLGSSPNPFLIEDSNRARWISIAQTKLVSGCPSRGIPIHEFENPSSISARKWEKPHHGSGVASTSTSARNTNHGSSRATSLASNTLPSHHHENSKAINHHVSPKKQQRKPPQQQPQQQQQQHSDDVTSSRSLTKLLNQMDSQAAGTRSHQPREQKVLSFLRESTKAQQSIKHRVLNPAERGEDDYHGDEGKNVLASSFVNGEPAPFLVSKKRKEQYIASARQQERTRQREVEILVQQENDLKTFEDYSQPKEGPLFSSSTNSASAKLPPLFGNASTRTANMFGKSGIAMNQSCTSDKNNNNNRDDGAGENNGTPQKILVRLPKVGLSLFSVSQRY